MYHYGQDVSLSYERLCDDNVHLLEVFDCGESTFNLFIFKDSTHKHTASYCYRDADTGKIVAYVSISCSGIMCDSSDDTPFSHQAGKSLVSAIEIKYFAVEAGYQHLRFDEESAEYETLSHEMFMNIVDRLIEIARNTIGAQAIVLYSTYEARNFYHRCGLLDFEQNMHPAHDDFTDQCYPMYMLLPS